MVNPGRINILKDNENKNGPVVYWMSRDQRVNDNWSMIFAQELAIKLKQPMAVAFCLAPNFPGATLRHYDFMINGLKEVFSDLKQINIPFYLLQGDPSDVLSKFIFQKGISHVVSDFDPLRIKRLWKQQLIKKAEITLYEVDSHNIVPCLIESQKCEFGAYTIRPKIIRLLPSFIDEFPSLKKQMYPHNFEFQEPDWETAIKFPSPDPSVRPVEWLKPGSIAAKEVMETFLDTKLNKYNDKRNDPNEDASSNLSPYLHFGHISAQRIALEIMKNFTGNVNSESFLEELIVRRELSDNFCFYNNNYDSFDGFPDWARNTLEVHRRDEREFLYDFEDFENGNTHDPLWNSAESEMVKTGKMHGYMRMYWAKKILEWSSSPEEALEYSLRLNDRYQLDGRDPNGYTGCAWSIGGVHDRAWSERPVYGKIRYMNYNGCKRKFDVDKYIQKWK